MAINAEHNFKICIPSSVIVTSPKEWKILEWNENRQTNTLSLITSIVNTPFWPYKLTLSILGALVRTFLLKKKNCQKGSEKLWLSF